MRYIIQIRKYFPEYTESQLFLPDWEGKPIWVLEDKKQPYGVKVDGMTCIPEGIYNVTVSESTRFKKMMMLLSNQSDGSIKKDGVTFRGVRPHGGNSTDNTEGCPLLNYVNHGNGKMSGRASDDVFRVVNTWIMQGHSVKWIITS
jgi:hypothetical protein